MIKRIAILCSIFLNLCIVRWEPVAIRMTWEAVGSQTFTYYSDGTFRDATGTALMALVLNPLCAFVSFVLLEREPKLPAWCVPLALVPTMLYGSVALWANYQRLITGPYPFLLVYQQTTRQTVLWCAAILAMNLLYAWLVWRLGGNCRKKRNVGLLFRS